MGLARAQPSPIRIVPPDPRLHGDVAGYWFVEDLAGVHAAQPVATGPVPHAVLSVNLAVPNVAEGVGPVPRASLLGLQPRARTWWPSSQTYFVMAMLTPRGLVRLFPAAGASAGALVDLAAVLGDRGARTLADDLDAAWDPARVTAQLDAWLLALRDRTRAPVELTPLAHACSALAGGASVDAAARLARCHPRQLHRWCVRHLGVGPKALMDLERAHASLRAVQRGGDPLIGYADAPHQIRAWRRRFGTTPGRYAAGELARRVAAADPDAPAFYL
ncbi:MAG: helix-turn-helix domain-containing protein [Myxococcales bacterium]|nr:helix-turn-helix domain-containing protein [Myxococcales bacterium]